MTPQEALSDASCVACLSKGEQQAIQTLAAMATIANPGGGGGGADTNFATDNLTFTGNRVHSGAGFGLTITGQNNITLSATAGATVLGAVTATIGAPQVNINGGSFTTINSGGPSPFIFPAAPGAPAGTHEIMARDPATGNVTFGPAYTVAGGPAAAGTLTGATLAANVLASSLTSVGSLSALTVTGAASAASLSITGTAGLGFIGLVAQSSAPSAPAGGYRQYADATGRLSWIRQSDGFTRTFDATLTANRVYTLPDASITFARTDAAQTFGGTQTLAGNGTTTGANIFTAGTYSALFQTVNTGIFGWSSTTIYTGTVDTILSRAAAANIRQGAADAAAPVPQTRSYQNTVAGTSNIAGANFTEDLSRGTGSATGGAYIIRTAPAGGSGTAQNALVTALTITGEGNTTLAVAKMLTFAAGTNQRAGNAVLVGGTVTVSNTTVSANTIVMLTRKTSGGTIGMAVNYTLSAGASFTITSDNILDTSTYSYILLEVS